ncbi:hypothetical protein H5410_013252 [Solanum commersonii]|uniref:Uncharacterized protein n=1 Tax=Solanum commersonii TaxID=4109 RepID=A0A9J6AUW8_SOLCO|nr:hypothetical protein H5410_013252 [Solanum commersonii]
MPVAVIIGVEKLPFVTIIGFTLTLWEDFGEIEGHEIASKMATEPDLLVILARSIGISTYQGLSLQTRYNSTLRVNPNYPQAVALINWY